MKYHFLGKINSPEELKKLSSEELNILCSEIREEIMNTVSLNGGHLSSNLGVVELTVALHRAFNAPDDAIIFDVGHQCYTHKLLTGRYKAFHTLRQKDGISGFMRPEESAYDPFVTGHSSNSVSAACGIAKANTMAGNDNYTVAVIGDGALTGGLAFEGLNNAASNHDRLILILNDNKMSISKNVGALARSLSRVRTNIVYYRIKNVVERFISRIPLIGKPLRNSIYNSKLMLKNVLYHSNIFEGLGFDYLGPVDGHNIEKLSQALLIAKNSKRPVLIHALTVKGKGYKFAEASPGNYHGVAPFNVEVGLETSGSHNFSDAFGMALSRLAEKDPRVVAVTAAMTSGTGLREFSLKYPSRFFDVGIAEQHAVTFAAGLATKGFKPFFAVYSSFLQRGFDQVLHDAAIENLPITLCVDRAGLVGSDGETHQGVFDISFLSAIPNVSIYSPSTYEELEGLLKKAVDRDRGVYVIRYPRGGAIPLPEELRMPKDEPTVLSKKSQTAVISYGINFSFCYKALQNEAVDLVKLNRLTDLSDSFIDRLKNYKTIYMFEETVPNGSIGEHLSARLIAKHYCGRFYHKTVKNEFVKQATQSEQRRRYGLDVQSVHEIVLKEEK